MGMIDFLKIKRENDAMNDIGTFDGQYSEYVPDNTAESFSHRKRKES